MTSAADFWDAVVTYAPHVTATFMFLMALYLTYERHMPMKSGDDENLDANQRSFTLYEVLLGIAVTVLIRLLLVHGNIVKPGVALGLAVLILAVLAGIFKYFLGKLRAAIWGTKFLAFAFYIVLFLILSGDKIASPPTPIVWGIMSVALFVGMIVAINYRSLQIYGRSFFRSFFIVVILVYTSEYLLPYLIRAIEKNFVIVRRWEYRYKIRGPTPEEDMNHITTDSFAMDSCHTSVGCTLRWISIIVLTIILSILTYQTNRQEEELHIAMKQEFESRQSENSGKTRRK